MGTSWTSASAFPTSSSSCWKRLVGLKWTAISWIELERRRTASCRPISGDSSRGQGASYKLLVCLGLVPDLDNPFVQIVSEQPLLDLLLLHLLDDLLHFGVYERFHIESPQIIDGDETGPPQCRRFSQMIKNN